MSDAIAEMVAKLRADTSDFDKKTDTAASKMQAVGKKMSDTGKGLTVGLTLPIVGMGVASLNAATQFNTGMANVASLLPGNIARVNELKNTVQDMSVQFGTSTDDLTGGLYQLLSAFGDDADSAKRLAIETKAAKAGVASVTDAINLTSAVTKAYGDTSAKAVGQVSDLALLTVRLGQTTFPELASSITQVTALSSNLKISQQQLFATFASTTGVVGSASQVATDMKGAMQALLAPTANMTDLFKKLGVANGQALIQQYGFAGAMNKVVAAAKASGQPLQTYIGSIEGQTLALSLAGPQSKAYSDALKQMGSAAGATDQAFKDQTQGVNAAGFAWSQAQAQANVLAQKTGDDLAPSLVSVLNAAKPLIGMLSGMVSGFTNLPAPVQTVVLGLLAATAALGPILVIGGKAVSAASAITSFFSSSMVQAGAKAVISGAQITAQFVGSMTLAAGRAVWAGIQITASFVASMVRAAAQAVVTGATFVASLIPALIAVTTQAIVTAATAIPGLIIGFIGWAASAGAAAVATLAATWPILAVVAGIALLVGAIILVVSHWSQITTALGNFAGLVGSTVGDVLGHIGYLKDMFLANINLTVNTAKAVFSTVVDALTFPIRMARQMIETDLNAITGFFSGLHLSLPQIKLPHFSIAGSLSLNPPSVPHLAVNWYAGGGIFSQPSVIGVGDAKSPEVVAPLDKLAAMLDHYMGGNGSGGKGGGDTYNFYGTNLTARDVADELNWRATLRGDTYAG